MANRFVVEDIGLTVLAGSPSDGLTDSRSDQSEFTVAVELIKGPHGDTIVVTTKSNQNLAPIPANKDSLYRVPQGNAYILQAPGPPDKAHPGVLVMVPKSKEANAGMQRLYEAATTVPTTALTAAGHFDSKTDKGSADLYFSYYGMLQHQQNMLQDYIRTGTYFSAIAENAEDFAGKAVMDVGCGSGILSLFAARAGARVVYAVEASNMAKFARQLADANPSLGPRIKVVHGKVEEIELPEKVDVLVSEPMGTLLVNERMLESYVYAREKFLKPGGKMFPRVGRIFVAAFSDPVLYAEVAAKAAFWHQPSFYGVDLTCLQAPAAAGYFAQVVVDQIPPNVLVSNTAAHAFDFSSCTEGELQDFTIPLSLQVAGPCTVHGIASWFDVLFDGSRVQRFLSTAPGLPVTHWFQLRCLLERPLQLTRAGDTVSGEMRLVAHQRQSYDVHLTLRAPPMGAGQPPQESSGVFDLKEPYYRQLVSGGWYGGAGGDYAGGGSGHNGA